jgi:hypothetical protein
MIGNSGKHLYTSWYPIEPDHTWVAFRDATFYGYGVLTVHNATTACVDAYCAAGDTIPCLPDELRDHFCFENQLINNPFPGPISPTSSPIPSESPSPTPSITVGASSIFTPSMASSSSPTKATVISGDDKSISAFQSATLGYGISIGIGSMIAIASIGYMIFRSRKKSLKLTKTSKANTFGEPVVAVGFTGSTSSSSKGAHV